MKLPRDLSGAELVKVLYKHYGYVRLHQEGSHMILQTEEPFHHGCPSPIILRCAWELSTPSSVRFLAYKV